MRSGDDSPIVDEARHEDAEHREDSGAFDPGMTTGYLRKSRHHDLPVEIGAAPFDPGPGTGYDERRARREAKRRRREQEKRRERLAKLEREIERQKRAEREARERAERERRARIRREREQRERAKREARERAERDEREWQLAAQRERRRRERQRQELRDQRRRELEAKLERERQEHARIAREREERARAERERVLRERAEFQARLEREREHRRRKAAVRPRPAAAARHKPSAAGPPMPRVERPFPPRRRRRQGLGWPTARAALALAAVTAVATVLGAAIGLPVPIVSDSQNLASLAGDSLETVDAGTAASLTKGPYFPVVTDNPDFGEGPAKFGAIRGGHVHEGQDVFATPGTPLVAVRDGIVIDGDGGKSFYAYGGGNSLVIYSPIDDRSYVYLHLLKPALVAAGDRVQAGQPVGQLGCSGSCDGPHLHFEIRRGRSGYGHEGKPIDPLPYLRRWPAAPAQ